MGASVVPFGISGDMGRIAVYVLVVVVPYGRLTVTPFMMGVTYDMLYRACK
jgi:hypothetical protein